MERKRTEYGRRSAEQRVLRPPTRRHIVHVYVVEVVEGELLRARGEAIYTKTVMSFKRKSCHRNALPISKIVSALHLTKEARHNFGWADPTEEDQLIIVVHET